MSVSADQARWDARYADPPPARPPEAFLVAHLAQLPVGRAVDLAGGVGRHALWLAGLGHDVLLADVSAVGLAVARDRAEAAGLSIRTIRLDLLTELPEGPFELIVLTWFLLGDRWAELAAQLAPGGVVAVVHPTRGNLERHAHPSARWLLAEGELADRVAAAGLEAVVLEEGWDDAGQHTARCIARRAAG
ncbi:MAG: tellurite methyltransferase [Myxococcota bacterium]